MCQTLVLCELGLDIPRHGGNKSEKKGLWVNRDGQDVAVSRKSSHGKFRSHADTGMCR